MLSQGAPHPQGAILFIPLESPHLCTGLVGFGPSQRGEPSPLVSLLKQPWILEKFPWVSSDL